jgi:hypothetical protein
MGLRQLDARDAAGPRNRDRAIERAGKDPRSARRMLRRMLEHEWEHVLELRSRLQV